MFQIVQWFASSSDEVSPEILIPILVNVIILDVYSTEHASAEG